MTYRTLLFDFDYTLADSARACVECINFGLRKMGEAEAAFEAACSTIGLSLPEIFTKLCGSTDAERQAAFARFFIIKADEIMVDWTRMLDPVPGLLPELKNRGFQLGIVSTKYRHRMEIILNRENLTGYFDVIIGAEDVRQFKPHPEGLQKAMRVLNAAPPTALYIGDSPTDARTAANGGIDFLAVLSGTTTADEFRIHGPVAVLTHLGELNAWLERNGAGRVAEKRSGA